MSNISPGTPTFPISTLRTVAAAAMAALISASVTAQVPPNHFAMGTSGPTNAGLYYVSLQDGSTTRVTGLPGKFTGAVTNGGVWSVVRRPDERLVLSTGATGGNPISMTMVTLNGAAVVAKKNLVIGTIPPNWRFGIGGKSLFPDGKRVLFGVPSQIYGAMSGYRLGIADFDAPTPTMTPLRLNGPLLGTFINDVEVTPDGEAAFVITHMGNQDARPFRLYQVDLQSGAVALIHTEPAVTGGRIRWGGFTANDEFLVTIKDFYGPATPKRAEFLRFKVAAFGQTAITRVSARQNEGVRAEGLDSVTGQVVMRSSHYRNSTTANPQSLFLGDAKTGDLKLLAHPPTGGWGNIRSVAMHSSLDFYGASPNARDVDFGAFPNAGGAPKAGNVTFTLTLTSSVAASNATALLMVGAQTTNLPLLGTRLLVDPLVVVPVTTPTPSNPFAMPLPIPPNVPAGTTVRVQWARCAAGTCRASRGLKITTQD